MTKRVIGILLMLVMLMLSFSNAFADDIKMTVQGPDGIEQIAVSTTSGKTYKITKGGEYIFTQSDPDTQVRFNITASAKDAEITIRLNGVNFKPYNTHYYNSDSGIYLGDGKNIRLVLEKGTVNRIHGGGTTAISIGGYTDCADVIIEGEGTLYATGGSSTYQNSYHSSLHSNGAGIYKGDGKNTLTINSGTIYASGGGSAASIGGGCSYSITDYGSGGTHTGRAVSNIIINGGTIYADTIGPTYDETANNITINGGAIYAKQIKCHNNLVINDGYVESIRGKNGTGIVTKDITINGGTIIAGSGNQTEKDGKYAAIGYDDQGEDCSIKITGGKVIAFTGTGYNPIGGRFASGSTHKIIPVTGKTITVKSGTDVHNILKTTVCTDETLISTVTAGNYIEINTACQHTGKTEVRGAAEPTYESEGYTGDVYCLECGEMIQSGTIIPKLYKTPQTGDDSHLILWLALLTLAGTATLILKRKTA